MPSWNTVAAAADSLRRDIRQARLAAVERLLAAAELTLLKADGDEFRRRYWARQLDYQAPNYQAWLFMGWDGNRRKVFAKVFDGASTEEAAMREAQSRWPMGHLQVLPRGVEPK
jgi:hypothetical protein